MKKVLYLVTGLCWGIYFSNSEILPYALFITVVSILIDGFVKE